MQHLRKKSIISSNDDRSGTTRVAVIADKRIKGAKAGESSILQPGNTQLQVCYSRLII